MSCSVMRVFNLTAPYDLTVLCNASQFSDGLQYLNSNITPVDAAVSIPCGHAVSKTAVLQEQETCLLCRCTVQACYPNFIIRSFAELFSKVVTPTAVTRSEMDNLSTSLECPVSGDFLTDAVIIVPCGHTISEVVARSMYGSMEEGIIEKQADCPLCCCDVHAYYPNHLARLFAEMLLHVQGWRPYDAKWGALIANLQDEGYSSAQINEAKNTLASIANDVVITAEMKTLYAKVFPKNQHECVAEIKKQLLEFTEEKIRSILDHPYKNLERERRELMQTGSFINERLWMLRSLGEVEVSNECCRRYVLDVYSVEGPARAEALINEVIRNFSWGAPVSFPMMASLLSKRKIQDCSFAHLFPISDVMQSMRILHRLADLGDKHAQNGLRVAYTRNSIGEDADKMLLSYTIEQRLQEIRKLALTGHAGSQYCLGAVCCHQALGEDLWSRDPCSFLTEQMRRQYIQELWECEVPYNYYLLRIIQENKIGELSYGLTLKERLEILHQRAEQGDEDALIMLYRAYKEDLFDGVHLSQGVDLSEEQRMNKMQELRARHPSVLNILVTGSAHLSDAEYLQEMENLAFHQNQRGAQKTLALTYVRNKLCERSCLALHIPLEKRLEKLRMLAHKNCSDAQYILLQAYGFAQFCRVPYIIEDADMDQRSNVQLLDTMIDSDVLQWALLDNDGAQRLILRNCQNDTEKDILSFLFAVRTPLLRSKHLKSMAALGEAIVIQSMVMQFYDKKLFKHNIN